MEPSGSQAESSSSHSVVAAASSLEPPTRKKTKRDSKWQDDWKKYNMKPSKKGPSFAHCNICSTDFSVASGGVHEIKRHVGRKKHCEGF